MVSGSTSQALASSSATLRLLLCIRRCPLRSTSLLNRLCHACDEVVTLRVA